ncbi:retrovirus-related Pol polyprotein from transposon 412 [Trichonephila clavipes]|nr:retrovirus-related Pol polyprotein from transposon 412 [Trichonephila clavipes]
METRHQKRGESLQEHTSEIERLAYLAFSDYPANGQEIISLQYFMDGVKDGEIQRTVRMADVQDLKSAMKLEAAIQASRRDRYSIRGAIVTIDAPCKSSCVKETKKKVRERFYWNSVRSDVEQWCHTCDSCAARQGPRKRTRGRLQLYNVGAPFERIAFDILGILPRSSDGNDNILVVMENFIKWPEAYPIPDQKAPTVAEVLVQYWISSYGVPLQLHSDKGETLILQFERD